MSSVLDEGTQIKLLLSLILLVTGTGLAGLAVSAQTVLRVPAALVAGAGAASWLLLDKDLEGPLIVSINRNHGIVLADLLTGPALVLVVTIVVLEIRRR